ncbi:hypothetical protein DZC72_10500 [Maribacter algicola]|uniref:2TM domain-containing protein n=1 Tax=Maribacter algicola TaxID=2498892 RepID=A0A3R8R1H2_9FLAO|nr:2TM domain-containing protein [Maribacter algicola]RRQ48146.1 hypothetical protein DZC72_10500 [Maribacter algicola]
MEAMGDGKNARLKRAKKRVKKIKGFYTHLTVYLLINSALLLIKIVGNAHYGESFMGPVLHFSTFGTWLFWGIGLFFHGVKVFYGRTLFSNKWEARQLEKFLEEERGNSEKHL